MVDYFNNKINGVKKRLYCLSVDLEMPWLSAKLLSLFFVPINSSGHRHILFFGSYAALDDVRALARYSGKFKYTYIDRKYIGYIVKKYLPYDDLAEGTYHIDERFDKGRSKIYDYINKMLPIIQSEISIDAMMSSNIGYIEQQELVKIGRDSHLPIIILYKEGLINPKIVDNMMKNYEYDVRKSQCDLFMCYASYIKPALLRTKIEGIDRDNIKVTGIPRLDYYIHSEVRSRDKVVLFSFYAALKYGDTGVDKEKIGLLEKASKDFHKLVVRYALDNPEKEVVIKTKPPHRHVEYIHRLAEEELGSDVIPSNLLITNQGDAMQLIMESRCVLCSNSTTLLETLLAKKPIGCPDFREYFDFPEWNIFEEYDHLVSYISNLDDLSRFIEAGKKFSALEERSVMEVLEKYIYCTDGTASKNVERYISELFH